MMEVSFWVSLSTDVSNSNERVEFLGRRSVT